MDINPNEELTITTDSGEAVEKPKGRPKKKSASKGMSKAHDIMAERQDRLNDVPDRDREVEENAMEAIREPVTDDIPNVLIPVPPRPGYDNRWFPVKILGKDITLTAAEKMGWTVADPANYSGHLHNEMKYGSGSCIESEHNILMERPKELSEKEEQRYIRRNRGKIDKIKQFLKKGQDIDPAGRFTKEEVPNDWHDGDPPDWV